MVDRLEGANQLNEVQFQSPIDSFPHRDNYSKITAVIANHALAIEALSTAASGSEVVDARNDEPDLNARITKADEIQGDGVFENVLNDFLMKQSGTPDDKVDVDTGEALINGRMIRVATVQTVDPANFSAADLERIDTVSLKNDGTVEVATGAEVALGSGLAEIEPPPNNSVILGFLFLRSPVGNLSPFPPADINNTDQLTESFIILNLQRFFVQIDRSHVETHQNNQVANGAFVSVDVGGVLADWVVTRGTLIQDGAVANKIFGDNAGKFTGNGVTGGNFIEQEIFSPRSFRGQFITLSAHLKLATGTLSKVGRLSLRLVGDTPEADLIVTADLNTEQFQRLHLVGRVDNSVTQIFVRLEIDTTDSNSTVGFMEGVQMSPGKILTRFSWPERIRIRDDGTTKFPGGIVTDDLTFAVGTTTTFAGTVVFTGTSDTTWESGSLIDHNSGSIEKHLSSSTDTYEASSLLVLDGEVKGDGHFDTEVAVLAWVGLGE